jgi:hypothetical protein
MGASPQSGAECVGADDELQVLGDGEQQPEQGEAAEHVGHRAVR